MSHVRISVDPESVSRIPHAIPIAASTQNASGERMMRMEPSIFGITCSGPSDNAHAVGRYERRDPPLVR